MSFRVLWGHFEESPIAFYPIGWLGEPAALKIESKHVLSAFGLEIGIFDNFHPRYNQETISSEFPSIVGSFRRESNRIIPDRLVGRACST